MRNDQDVVIRRLENDKYKLTNQVQYLNKKVDALLHQLSKEKEKKVSGNARNSIQGALIRMKSLV